MTSNIAHLMKVSLFTAMAIAAINVPSHSFAQTEGTKDGGGGNGVKQGSTVIPLDVYFMENNISVRLDQNYKNGFAELQGHLDRIDKALPSLARDLRKNLETLTWIDTKLDIESENCMNNVGIYRIQQGTEQVILACQSQRTSEVVLHRLVATMSPQYQAVIFLHELFVKTMLQTSNQLVVPKNGTYNYQINTEKYRQLENRLVQNIIPYILKSNALDPQRMFKIAVELGFTHSDSKNSYLIEAFPEIRLEQEQLLDKANLLIKEIKSNEASIDAVAEIFIRCDGTLKTTDSSGKQSRLSTQYLTRYLESIDYTFKQYDLVLEYMPIRSQIFIVDKMPFFNESQSQISRLRLSRLVDQCRSKI